MTSVGERDDSARWKPVAPAPKPRRRWLRALVALLAVLVVLALAAKLVAPVVLEDRLRQALAQQGFDRVALTVTDVGLGSATVSSLRLGRAGSDGGSLYVPTIEVGYDLLPLLRDGRVRTVTLRDPVWTLATTADAALAPFGALFAASGDGTPVAAVTALPRVPLGAVAVERARIVSPQGTSAALDLRATLGDRHWQLRLDAVLGEQSLQVRGELDADGGAADGPVTVRIGGEKPLQMHGTLAIAASADGRTIDLDLQRGAAEFALDLPGGTWRGSGPFAVRAHVPPSHTGPARLEVQLDGVDVTTSQGVEAAGLAGTVAVVGSSSPSTLGPQQVQWRRIAVGQLAAGAGRASLGLREDGALVVHEAQWAVGDDGAMQLAQFSWSPARPVIETRLSFQRVPLEDWLAFLTDGRVTGHGRISGSLGMEVTTSPQLDVRLRSGQLAADSSGVVRLLEDETAQQLVREHARQIAAASGRGKQGNQVQERIVGALENFSYSALEFRVEPEASGPGVTLRVHLAGKGVEVPQELDLDVNFNGFDQALDLALATKLGLDRARRRLEGGISFGPR